MAGHPQPILPYSTPTQTLQQDAHRVHLRALEGETSPELEEKPPSPATSRFPRPSLTRPDSDSPQTDDNALPTVETPEEQGKRLLIACSDIPCRAAHKRHMYSARLNAFDCRIYIMRPIIILSPSLILDRACFWTCPCLCDLPLFSSAKFK